MEVEVVRLIQKECADALLDAGISVPLKEWRACRGQRNRSGSGSQ